MRCRIVRSALTLVTCSLAGTACFDVHTVDPGPAVLDDFEDGDLIPSLHSFSAWSCSTYTPNASFDCALAEGFQGSAGLSFAFSLVDPPDGDQQRGTIEIETHTDTLIDLTGLSAITFDVRLTNAPPPSPTGAALRLDLKCSTAIGENGAVLRDFIVVQSVAYTAEWSSINLAMSNFGPAEWMPGALRGGTPACLRVVDGFRFVFDPGQPDGQTVAGVFSIDNVRLR
jgi:hypothetical protein